MRIGLAIIGAGPAGMAAAALAAAHGNLFAPMVAAGRLDASLDLFSARRFDVPAAA